MTIDPLDPEAPTRDELLAGLDLDELLVRAGRAVTGWRQRATAAHGLTAAGLAVLGALDETPGPSQRDLAADLGISPAALTPTVDVLEEGGHLRRERDPDDRRVVRLRLTRQGVRAEASASAELAERWQRAMPVLTGDEQGAVRRYLLAVLAAADWSAEVVGARGGYATPGVDEAAGVTARNEARPRAARAMPFAGVTVVPGGSAAQDEAARDEALPTASSAVPFAGLVVDLHGVLSDGPAVAEAVARVRAAGTPTALLTTDPRVPSEAAALVDVVLAGGPVPKRDPAAYRGAAAALGVAVARCVVVDDAEVNLRAARAAGAVVVRHVDAGSTVAELEALFGLGPG